jgi:hypothetical protein
LPLRYTAAAQRGAIKTSIAFDLFCSVWFFWGPAQFSTLRRAPN